MWKPTKSDLRHTSVADIKVHMSEGIDGEVLALLLEDERKSVQKLGQSYLKQQEKALQEMQRVAALYTYENRYYDKDLFLVAGVDEVGRGPIAGPVTVSAVILPPNLHLEGLNDSKKIPHHKREALYEEILEKAVAVSCISYDPEVIDRLNIYEATRSAMYEAIRTLKVQPQVVLADAMKLPDLTMPVESLIKGDAKSASIAAASIVAKVTRDRYMDRLEDTYPGYGFSVHKGYYTELHKEALLKLGVTPVHRRSFEPIKSMVK